MSESHDLISVLRLLRDVLNDYTILIKRLSKTSEKHNIALHRITNLNVSQESIKPMIDATNPTKVGYLIKALQDLANVKNGMKEFMTYDSGQLEDLGIKLASATKNLDKVLRGLPK